MTDAQAAVRQFRDAAEVGAAAAFDTDLPAVLFSIEELAKRGVSELDLQTQPLFDERKIPFKSIRKVADALVERGFDVVLAADENCCTYIVRWELPVL